MKLWFSVGREPATASGGAYSHDIHTSACTVHWSCYRNCNERVGSVTGGEPSSGGEEVGTEGSGGEESEAEGFGIEEVGVFDSEESQGFFYEEEGSVGSKEVQEVGFSEAEATDSEGEQPNRSRSERLLGNGEEGQDAGWCTHLVAEGNQGYPFGVDGDS